MAQICTENEFLTDGTDLHRKLISHGWHRFAQKMNFSQMAQICTENTFLKLARICGESIYKY